MGALPKNKITSVERGKRRRGNTPTITKDVKITSPQMHKRGIVASFFKAFNITSSKGVAKKKPVAQKQVAKKPTSKKPVAKKVAKTTTKKTATKK